MVIDVTNFVDDTWLSQNGTIHSDALHVMEKLTREGNVINWELSIEDPKVFTAPWVYSRPPDPWLGGRPRIGGGPLCGARWQSFSKYGS